ncbi:MAG: arylsulfatase [Verrucomicrobia bacterium]|nr:arylsulfatase [Verrucomicrobiota bacterium]
MKIRFAPFAFAGLLALLAVNPGLRAAGPESGKPNILFILADDLGWADVSYHGGEIKTPNLDKLAASGVRLEQFYVQPVCSPTRAALLTGRYPMRHGLQVGVVRPWAQYGLPLEERTLPQALKEAGYITAICGKWHLGHFEPAYLPTRRGFDHQYGHYNGALDYFTHVRDGGFDWHRDDKVSRDEGYTTHLLAKECERLIAAHDLAKPLFLYVPFNAVHAPHQVPEKYAEPYAHLKGPRRTYAGMVAAMDEAIGQIVGALEKRGLRKNTLIFFCSDNGGPQPGVVTSNGPLRASKGTLYEGGIRVPALAVWDGKLKPGTVCNEPLHIVDWYPTLLKLAGVSLTQKLPLDGRDLWPTLAEGKSTPHEEILHNLTPAAGAIRRGDWKLVLNGARGTAEPEAKPEGGQGRAGGRVGKPQGRGRANPRAELFNLAQDPNEKTDLSEQFPDKLKELRERLDFYARQAVPPKSAPRAPNFKSPKVWGQKDEE